MPDFDTPSRSFLENVISDSRCFLCGQDAANQITKEHVFPKWLLRKHNLWDKELTLLNGTYLRYRQLTIPCCGSCNGSHLSALESYIRTAVESGYDSCVKLDKVRLFQWLGKIFYGILRKEVTLLHDRRSDSGQTILTVDWLEELRTLHLFLQSIRRPMSFNDGYPFSVLVVNLHEIGNEMNYSFRDAIHPLVASLRTGTVGFIVAFEDAGLSQGSYGRYINDVGGRKLHPIQFDELFAKVTYQASLMTRTPKFISSIPLDQDGEISISMLPLAGLSSVPLLREWDQRDFAEDFAQVLESWGPWIGTQSIDDPSFFTAPNCVRTWMHSPDGALQFFDRECLPLS